MNKTGFAPPSNGNDSSSTQPVTKSVVKIPAPETAKNMFAPPSDNESSNAIDLSKLNPDKSINSK